jgi:hypothetical protein
MTKTRKLLSVSADAKTIHGEEHGVLTGIQYFAPARASGIINLCSFASAGCIESCLNTAGRGSFDAQVPVARLNRTIVFVRDRRKYWERLVREIAALIRAADRRGFIPAVRLNGTSDMPWERLKINGGKFDGMTIFEAFPGVNFYDYTKYPLATRNKLPANYHLTYSRSENSTAEQIAENLEHGRNVAVVFNVCRLDNRGSCHNKCKCPLPATWNGHAVISGDGSDLRFTDPEGVIVGLRAKGRARWDTSGFVVRV